MLRPASAGPANPGRECCMKIRFGFTFAKRRILSINDTIDRGSFPWWLFAVITFKFAWRFFDIFLWTVPVTKGRIVKKNIYNECFFTIVNPVYN